ncbi:MAG TPA: PHB depolymerase family esterase [Aestuariivirgaceae bacterium]|nr:PHB depolymerase family esterase [Aestuariivirgaceae bacterium]
MSIDFSTAMRRATMATRAGNAADATRIIQEALAGRPAGDGPAEARPRRPLRETVRALRRGRPSVELPRGREISLPPLPDGAQFLTRSFACAAGTRQYKLYVPASAAHGLGGLVVMLHGCTQTPEDFATDTNMNAVAEANRLLVAYPAQTRAHNAASCWNWFNPADQRRDAGEPAILAGLARELAAKFDIPREKIFAAGLSAGGAMAAVLGATYPDVFAAIGVHSGLPAGAANDVISAFAAMRGDSGTTFAPMHTAEAGPGPRTIIFHGTADRTVHAGNAEQLAAAARARAPSGASRSERGTAESGRAWTRTLIEDPQGTVAVELWMIEGAGHAWAGGHAGGSYTDPSGPDASAEMVRFFLSPEPAMCVST